MHKIVLYAQHAQWADAFMAPFLEHVYMNNVYLEAGTCVLHAFRTLGFATGFVRRVLINTRNANQGTAAWRRAHETVWLADGYFGLLWAIKGDLDYLGYFLGFPRVTATRPCGLCPCTIHDDMPWTDFRAHAPWIPAQYSKEAYEGLFGGCNALLSLPAVSVLSIAPDYMHVKFLGTDQFLLGSVLYLLIHHLMAGHVL